MIIIVESIQTQYWSKLYLESGDFSVYNNIRKQKKEIEKEIIIMAITKKIADYFNKHSYEIMCSMMAYTGNVNVELLSELRNR